MLNPYVKTLNFGHYSLDVFPETHSDVIPCTLFALLISTLCIVNAFYELWSSGVTRLGFERGFGQGEDRVKIYFLEVIIKVVAKSLVLPYLARVCVPFYSVVHCISWKHNCITFFQSIGDFEF